MTEPLPEQPERSYGCSMGCGAPFDIVIISVQDASTLMLCIPCHLRLAMQLMESFVDGDSDQVQRMISEAGAAGDAAPFDGNVRRRGHNAPVNSDDAGLIEAYDDLLTAEEVAELLE